MPGNRRSTDAGHRRKFLVVIDDTKECSRALLYAARRAEHTNGALTLLFVISPADFKHWMGVENIMRAEAMEEAESTLSHFADLARTYSPVIEPQLVIREGNRAEEIVKLIDEDDDISILVLAAATDKEGPGPLVTALAGKQSGTFLVPITIVPGHLDDQDISAIT
jgi:nucleotide-binding universal stress UspA family protein